MKCKAILLNGHSKIRDIYTGSHNVRVSVEMRHKKQYCLALVWHCARLVQYGVAPWGYCNRNVDKRK